MFICIMEKVLNYLNNFYIIVLLVFIIWMLFFDSNDLITQFSKKAKIEELKRQREYYSEKIGEIQSDIEELRTNEATLEKFAREKYLMKKDNEDVYIVVPEQGESD